MKSSILYTILAVVLLTPQIPVTEACPCSSSQCCFLLFNFVAFKISFCANRNRNTSRCRKSNYCTLNSDCPNGGTCAGATLLTWGQCNNPC